MFSSHWSTVFFRQRSHGYTLPVLERACEARNPVRCCLLWLLLVPLVLLVLLHADAQFLGLLSTRQPLYHNNPVLHFWRLSVSCGWCSKLLPWPWLVAPWNRLSPAADKCGEIWKDESWWQASLWKTSSLNTNVIFLVVSSSFLVNLLFSGRDGNESYAFYKLWLMFKEITV